MFKLKKYTFLIIIGLCLCSCSANKSRIGSWSKKDKKKLDEFIKNEEKNMTAFGDKKQDFIDCIFNKFENTYSSFSMAMDANHGKEEIKKCFKDIYGPKPSKIGKWNNEDKQRFNSEMESIKSEIDQLGEYKDAFLSCYFEKIQNTFSSFNQAYNNSSKCQQLATKCANEIMK